MNPTTSDCQRIAVTGANGFIGRVVCARLAETGHRVRALTRHPAQIPEAEDHLCVEDFGTAQGGLFDSCDAVVNCAARVHVTRREDPDEALAAYRAVNRDLALVLARRARDAGATRFIQLSSVAAMGTSAAGIVRDGDPELPASPYGIAKLEGDRALAALADTRFAVSSLRPPAVFGPGVAVWFAQLMAAARIGLPLPVGRIHNLRSFAYVGNIADAVCLAALGAAGHRSGAYLITDSAPVSTAELYRKLLAMCGQPDRVWNWPGGLMRGAATLALGSRAASLVGNAAYDGSRFARDYAWHPRIGFDEALRITMARTQ